MPTPYWHPTNDEVRYPTPGGDSGSWGYVLENYLAVSTFNDPADPTNANGLNGTLKAAAVQSALGLSAGLGTGVGTFLTTPSSANLASALTDETGSGKVVFDTSPILTTPNLGTPSAINLSNAASTSLPIGAINATGTQDASHYLTGAGTWATISGAGLSVGTTSVSGGTSGYVLTNGATLGNVQATATPTASAIAEWDANKNFAANAVVPGFTSTTTAGGTTSLTISSTQNQVFTGSSTQIIVVPQTSVPQGAQYTIINRSTGALTIRAADASTITQVAPQTSATVTALQAAPSNNAHWNLQYLGIIAGSVSNPISLTVGGSNAGQLNFGGSSTTMTFPSASDNVVGEASTNTLTHKTYDTAGTGNAFKINGTSITAVVGSGSVVLASGAPTATPTASTIATWDANSNLSANAFIPGAHSVAANGGTVSLTIADAQTQIYTGASTQIVKLPTTSVAAGAQYTIINLSSGNCTVQSSGANQIVILPQNGWATFTANVATPTTAAQWSTFGQTTTDTLQNKTFDTANNTFKIAGTTLVTTGTAGSNVVLATSPVLTTPNLGTPSALTLTNATGLPISGLSASTSTAIGVGSIELGNASDTTIARSAAGQIQVEGVDVITTTNTETLTNKRINPRVVALTDAATIAVNSDTTDIGTVTLGSAIGSTRALGQPSGTPVLGQKLLFRITQDGSGSRALTLSSSFFNFGTDITSITLSTAPSLSDYIGMIYNGSKWDIVSFIKGFS